MHDQTGEKGRECSVILETRVEMWAGEVAKIAVLGHKASV
jgi:hypothetical protein